MTATTSPIDLLRGACATGDLPSNASLSEDGKLLTLFGSKYDATIPHALALGGGGGGRVVSYTLASVYLQLINPALLRYHKACGSAGVRDPVKTLDRDHVISHFFGGGAGGDDVVVDGAAAATATEEEEDDDMDVASDEDEDEAEAAKATRATRAPRDERRPSRDSSGKRRRDNDGPSSSRKSSSSRPDKSRRGEEEGRSRKGGGGKGRASAAPITNEMLVANLGKIVDKRHAAPATTTTPAREGGGGDGAAEADADAPEESSPIATATPAPTTAATTAAGGDDRDGPGRTPAEGAEAEDRDLLLAWLSPEGFRVDSPSVASAIEADREAVRRITASEIPVGDSASVLRAGAGGEVAAAGAGGGGAGEPAAAAAPGPSQAGGAAGVAGAGGVRKRDFARVLEIYHEVAAAEERAKRAAAAAWGRPPPPPPALSSSSKGKGSSSSSAAAAGSPANPPVAGNPIIVVPNAMTSVINMINAGIFLGKEGVYLNREQAMTNPGAGKRGGAVTITRKLAPRLGGVEITYEIIDNPATRLKKDEWNRVVAVICQGASWQFKGWRYSDPVDLFSRTFGFYVGLEGAVPPSELQGWNVKTGKVSRDRRGLDNVCLASFWNGLEEFMAVHKQDFINSQPSN